MKKKELFTVKELAEELRCASTALNCRKLPQTARFHSLAPAGKVSTVTSITIRRHSNEAHAVIREGAR